MNTVDASLVGSPVIEWLKPNPIFEILKEAQDADRKRRGNLKAIYRSITPDHIKVRLQWESGEMSDGPEMFRMVGG